MSKVEAQIRYLSTVHTNAHICVNSLKVASENLRIALKSSILQDIYKIELIKRDFSLNEEVIEGYKRLLATNMCL